MIYPSITARSLFLDTLPPLRRAARGNGLVTDALIRALKRLARSARNQNCKDISSELDAIGAETRKSNMLEREIDAICADIQEAIEYVETTGQTAQTPAN